MTPPPPTPPVESFYSRRIFLRWLVGLSLLWLALLVLLVGRERLRRAEDAEHFRAQLRSLGGELASLRREVGSLRKGKDALEERYRALKAEHEKLARRASPPGSPPPPPASVVTKLLDGRTLRVGESLELRPGRAYLALVRLTGGRAELKLSLVGEERPASRMMAVADTWQFTLEGVPHTLLLQGLDRAGGEVRLTLLRREKAEAAEGEKRRRP